MATTLVSEPGSIATAYNPLNYVLTNPRTGVEEEAVTNVADNGSGFCRISIDNSGGEWLVDDVVRGTDFTEDGLNVEMLVTAVAAAYVDIDVAYIVAYSGLTGTLTRANNVTYKGTFSGGVVSGDFFVKARNGETTIDVSRFIQSYLSEDHFTTVGFHSPAESVSSVPYRVTFVIYWVRDDGTILEDLTPLLTSIIDAFNIALNGDEVIADFIMSTSPVGKFLTRVRSGNYVDKYCLAFITEADFVTVVVRAYTGVTLAETKYIDQGVEDNRAAIYLDSSLLKSTYDRVEISVWDGDPDVAGVIMSETYTLTPTLGCGKKLVEWKNKLGGFEFSYFKEATFSSQMKATQLKEDPPTVAFIDNGKAVSLSLGMIDEVEADYFEDLAQSRVLWFDDEEAAIFNNKMKYSRNPIKNQIAIILQPKNNN